MKTMARNQKFSSEQTLIRIFHRSFKREKKKSFHRAGKYNGAHIGAKIEMTAVSK